MGFLGLLRQHLRNRQDRCEAANPTSATLRAKVLTALEAGFSNPTAISGFVDSPVTVVSRTLRKLVDEGRVERRANEGSNDGRIRNYDVVSPPARTLTGTTGDPDEAELSSIEPSILIPFAERQIRTNPMTATELVPDLVAVGRRQANSPSDRVAALSAASAPRVQRRNRMRSVSQATWPWSWRPLRGIRLTACYWPGPDTNP